MLLEIARLVQKRKSLKKSVKKSAWGEREVFLLIRWVGSGGSTKFLGEKDGVLGAGGELLVFPGTWGGEAGRKFAHLS